MVADLRDQSRPAMDSTVTLPHPSPEDGTVFEHMFSCPPCALPKQPAHWRPSTCTGTHHMRVCQKREGLNPHTASLLFSTHAGWRPAFTEHLREAGVHCTNRGKEDYNFKTPALAWDASSRSAHWRSRPEGAPFFSVFNLFGSHESQVWERGNTADGPSPDAVPVPPILPDLPAVRQDLAVNYGNLLVIDSLVGNVIQELKEDGLYNQTTILFSSDHGGPFPGFKRSASDAGLHVPLIIKWAEGVPHSERNDGLFSFLDLAPTALAHFGLPVPEALPGTPMTPDDEGHPAVFGAADRSTASSPPAQFALNVGVDGITCQSITPLDIPTVAKLP